MPPALVFQLEVFYKVDRLLTGQQKGTTAQWNSNKTSLWCHSLSLSVYSCFNFIFCHWKVSSLGGGSDHVLDAISQCEQYAKEKDVH